MQHSHSFTIYGHDGGGDFHLCSICFKRVKGHGEKLRQFKLRCWYWRTKLKGLLGYQIGIYKSTWKKDGESLGRKNLRLLGDSIRQLKPSTLWRKRIRYSRVVCRLRSYKRRIYQRFGKLWY